MTGWRAMKLSTLTAWLSRKAVLGDAGVAGMELALATPMLALLMTGGFDFGRAIYEQHRLTAAAQAGVQYATASVSNLANPAGIIAAARADASDTTNSLTVTAGSCTCPTGTSLCSTAATCTGSSVSGTYQKVTVSESYSTIGRYPFVSNPFTLTAQSMVRVQ
jgi:Flp pilus assembly protein TadG